MRVIKSIKSIEEDSIKSIGFNGYKTNRIYVVDQKNDGLNIKIQIKDHKLNKEYI